MFCGMVVIIILGVVVECICLFGYVICVLLIVGLIYLVFVYWVWGNVFDLVGIVFFVDRGFVDFVGLIVVYGIGVWFVLVVFFIFGLRFGWFSCFG